MEKFIKGEYGAIETKGGSLLSLLIRKVIVFHGLCQTLQAEQEAKGSGLLEDVCLLTYCRSSSRFGSIQIL
jgi:hypothetical protein